MMSSINLFRQAQADADAQSTISSLGLALLVVGALVSIGWWQLAGPRWYVGASSSRRPLLRVRPEGGRAVAEDGRPAAGPLPRPARARGCSTSFRSSTR